MNEEILAYIDRFDEKRRPAYQHLLTLIADNIADGFELQMQYGMPSFVVPLSKYPKGYHVDPSTPLPFLGIGIQKGHIGLYHMGIYADQDLLAWFQDEYKRQVPTILDMGKSCIRLKNVNNIPYSLIADLVSKMSADEWINIYESKI